MCRSLQQGSVHVGCQGLGCVFHCSALMKDCCQVEGRPQSTACCAWYPHATVYTAVAFGTESGDVVLLGQTEKLLLGLWWHSQAATGMHAWRQAGRQAVQQPHRTEGRLALVLLRCC
jgi:hypothetical protein